MESKGHKAITSSIFTRFIQKRLAMQIIQKVIFPKNPNFQKNLNFQKIHVF